MHRKHIPTVYAHLEKTNTFFSTVMFKGAAIGASRAAMKESDSGVGFLLPLVIVAPNPMVCGRGTLIGSFPAPKMGPLETSARLIRSVASSRANICLTA